MSLKITNVYRFNANGNLCQNNPRNAPRILQLPSEILKKIGENVATGANEYIASKYICNFSETCVLMHLITKEKTIQNIIALGKKKLAAMNSDNRERELEWEFGTIEDDIWFNLQNQSDGMGFLLDDIFSHWHWDE